MTLQTIRLNVLNLSPLTCLHREGDVNRPMLGEKKKPLGSFLFNQCNGCYLQHILYGDLRLFHQLRNASWVKSVQLIIIFSSLQGCLY